MNGIKEKQMYERKQKEENGKNMIFTIKEKVCFIGVSGRLPGEEEEEESKECKKLKGKTTGKSRY